MRERGGEKRERERERERERGGDRETRGGRSEVDRGGGGTFI